MRLSWPRCMLAVAVAGWLPLSAAQAQVVFDGWIVSTPDGIVWIVERSGAYPIAEHAPPDGFDQYETGGTISSHEGLPRDGVQFVRDAAGQLWLVAGRTRFLVAPLPVTYDELLGFALEHMASGTGAPLTPARRGSPI